MDGGCPERSVAFGESEGWSWGGARFCALLRWPCGQLGSEHRGAEGDDLHGASRIPLSILNLPRFSRSLPFTSVTSVIPQCVWLPPLSFYICMCMLSHFSRVRLCDPMDRSPLGSSVHGILQARILEWFVMPSSRGSSPPRDRTHVFMFPALSGGFFTTSTTWQAPCPIYI